MFYVYKVGWTLFSLMNPLHGVEITANERTVDPLWKEGDNFSILTFLSHSSRFAKFRISNMRASDRILLEEKDLRFGANQGEQKVHLRIASMSSSPIYNPKENRTEITAVASSEVWKRIQNNG